MPISALAALLILVQASLLGARETTCPPGCHPGRWSTEAIDLSTQKVKAPYGDRDIRVYSPDHQKSFRVVNDRWWVEVGGKRLSQQGESSALYYPAEVAWAPDSRAFFLTLSFGDTTGYTAAVYRVSEEKLIPVLHMNPMIQKDFDRHHKCFDAGTGNDPNVAGLKWLQDSDRLLVIAEVPPVGICKQMGYFGGYEISLASMKIVGRFSPEQLADRWIGALGDRLSSNFSNLSQAAKASVP